MKYTAKQIALLLTGIVICTLSVACASGNPNASKFTDDPTSEKPGQSEHIHQSIGDWSSDEQTHWHTCACGETFDLSDHALSEWRTSAESGCFSEGKQLRNCLDCDYTETQSVPAIGSHSYTDGVCERCGKPEPSEGLVFELSDGNGYTVVGIGNCTDTALVIPDIYEGKPVTAIGERAFSFCDHLTSVTLGANISSIGASAFFGCTRMETFNAPTGLTEIGTHAFESCVSLREVTLPDSLLSIEWGAFYGCLSLEEITVPRSVTSIAHFVFAGCDALKSVTVERGNEIYHSSGNCIIESASKELVAGCQSSVIPDDGSVTAIGDYAFYDCNGLKTLQLPDSVTAIGERAYYACQHLTSITLSASMERIGDSAFEACAALRTITVEAGNAVYHSDGNCLIETASRTLLMGCQSSVIPSDGSVTAIAADAFYNCDGLTEIVIPEGITSIGKHAFYDCNALTSVSLPVGLSIIDEGVFSRCNALASITLPESLRSIGKGAFDGCTALSEAAFGRPEGWTVVIEDGETILPDLSSPTQAALCLTDTCKDGSWTAID